MRDLRKKIKHIYMQVAFFPVSQRPHFPVNPPKEYMRMRGLICVSLLTFPDYQSRDANGDTIPPGAQLGNFERGAQVYLY